MNEDQLMAVVGRLYINLLISQNEAREARALVKEYADRAQLTESQPESTEEPSDG